MLLALLNRKEVQFQYKRVAEVDVKVLISSSSSIATFLYFKIQLLLLLEDFQKFNMADTKGALNLMTSASVMAAVNNKKFKGVCSLGVLTGSDSPAWGKRSHAVKVTQISVGNNNIFNDDAIVGHVGVGTHLDGLGHICHQGKYYGGHTQQQVYKADGLNILGIAENISHIIAPFKVLDMVDCLSKSNRNAVLNDHVKGGYEITKYDIMGAMAKQGVNICKGDIVLLHTGWIKHWNNPDEFNASEPGLGLEAAQYLASKKIIMVAADTVALEAQKTKEDGGP